MNRRNFCKIVSLATAGAFGGLTAEASGGSLPKARLTVIRRHCFSDLQSGFLDEPETGPCSALADGQQFVAVNGRCPEGMCPKAWQSLLPEIRRLASCGHDDHEKCGLCNDRCAVACCSDGTRPVVFCIELL